jgi:hypothetical protein
VFASNEVTQVRSVSEKSVRDRNLPCIPEEVKLYLHQKVSVLSVVAEITEIMKRVEVRTVNGFVALFAPIGLFPGAIIPLIYAALDLIINTTRQHPG